MSGRPTFGYILFWISPCLRYFVWFVFICVLSHQLVSSLVPELGLPFLHVLRNQGGWISGVGTDYLELDWKLAGGSPSQQNKIPLFVQSGILWEKKKIFNCKCIDPTLFLRHSYSLSLLFWHS